MSPVDVMKSTAVTVIMRVINTIIMKAAGKNAAAVSTITAGWNTAECPIRAAIAPIT